MYIEYLFLGGHRSSDCMVVGFIITYAIIAYHHLTLWVRTPLRRGVLDTALYDQVCQRLVTGQWLCPGTPVSSSDKTDHHDITEILLKMALKTIILSPNHYFCLFFSERISKTNTWTNWLLHKSFGYWWIPRIKMWSVYWWCPYQWST
jgi:hypothetical protein